MRAEIKGKIERPLGVTIISLVGFATSFSYALLLLPNALNLLSGLDSIFLTMFVLFAFIPTIIGFFIYWLLWRMKRDGMILALILNILSVIVSIVALPSIELSEATSVTMLLFFITWGIIVSVYLYKQRSLFK